LLSDCEIQKFDRGNVVIVDLVVQSQKRAKASQKSEPGVWPAAPKLFSDLIFWLLLVQAKSNSPHGN